MEIIYFLIASFLVVIVPGPTVSLIIANSLKSGMRAGILNVVGTQLGLIILILLLALGFKIISPFLEDVIKVVRIIGRMPNYSNYSVFAAILTTALLGLAWVWRGLACHGVPWPGYGVAWPGSSVAWPC